MYSRDTELRQLRPNDVNMLSNILEHEDCWKKLMQIIPKDISAMEANKDVDGSNAGIRVVNGFKYNADDIKLIEKEHNRCGIFHAKILFDEWGTSGRKHERPTLDILLKLLLKADLYRAAEHVAVKLLNESKPERPQNGPGARITLSDDDDDNDDIDELDDDLDKIVNNDCFYPDTDTLNAIANNTTDNNKDYQMKYHRLDKRINLENNSAPIPPPRASRSIRSQSQNLHKQQQQQLQQHISPTVSEKTTTEAAASINAPTGQNNWISPNIPNFSELQMISEPTFSSKQESGELLPNLSILAQNSLQPTSEPSVLPDLSVLHLSSSELQRNNEQKSELAGASINSHDKEQDHDNYDFDDIDDDVDIDDDDDDEDDDDDDDDDDNCMPNLSICDQRSSNNDSSLTNVTETSRENSFETSSNDCSSVSNDNDNDNDIQFSNSAKP